MGRVRRPGAPKLDFVFTVCDDAANETCPIWPGQPITAHWGLPDPVKAVGSEAERSFAFADTMRMLNQRIGIFVSLPLRHAEQALAPGETRRNRTGALRGAQRTGLSSVFGPSLARRLAAEGIGTAFLLAAIVGSGIMAARLSGGNEALALLCNSAATGAILVVLIATLAPVSGAHLNPAVTLAFALRREIAPAIAGLYAVAQLAGAVLGTWTAHLMFGQDVLQLAGAERSSPALWLSEGIATFGLVLTIFGAQRARPDTVPALVGLYIASAYWFTASTSFANPAVTAARALTDGFTGIAPSGVPPYIAAQIAGALAAVWLSSWLFERSATTPR